MKLEPLYPIAKSQRRRTSDPEKYQDVKAWVIKAIAEEDQKSNSQMWEDEPSADEISSEQLKRIRFLRKHGKHYPDLNIIADILERCKKENRCCSGACPECNRLFQRFYVRRSKSAIRDIIASEGNELIAICIIPTTAIVRPGDLKDFSITNFQRRIKAGLDKAEIKYAIGGVDISFNEDREKEWKPYICPHIYLITSTNDKEALREIIKKVFEKSAVIKRPIKIADFENIARRRSYSLKKYFKRRISDYKERKDGKSKSRNTSDDKLRVRERIELYRYLHQTGLAARVVFRGVKPEMSGSTVRFRKA